MDYFKGKTILITGATGLIGYNLVNSLMKCDVVKIIALGRTLSKLEELFGNYKDNVKFHIVEHDMCQALELDDTIDVIFHAAGSISSDIIRNYPTDIIFSNLSGTKNCLDYVKKQKEEKGIDARFVLFSSATIYNSISPLCETMYEKNTSISEPLDSIYAPYSEAKRMTEVMATAYSRQFNVDCVICRISYVYGFTYYPPRTGFYSFIQQAIEGKDLVLNNPIMQKRDNIYIDDVISGILTICSKGKKAEAYNISSAGLGNNYAAMYEIADSIVRVANSYSIKPVIQVKFNGFDQVTYEEGMILNNDKLLALGWELKSTLYDGINSTVKAFMEK